MALGPQAKPAVPALIPLISGKGQHDHFRAVFALRWIGPAATAALPEMIECLKDPDESTRAEAVLSVGEIHQEPDRVVPILMGFLNEYEADQTHWSKHWNACYRAMQSRGDFGAQAKPAIPILIRLLNDQRPFIRAEATNSLKSIDPDAAANAGPK